LDIFFITLVRSIKNVIEILYLFNTSRSYSSIKNFLPIFNPFHKNSI